MYAVIQTGGKQYRVEEGTYLKIEKLELGAADHPCGGSAGGGEYGDPADRSVHAARSLQLQMAAVCRVCDKRDTNATRIRYTIVMDLVLER